MNSGMLFQMPGLSSNVSSKTANTQKVDAGNKSDSSFKKEMDKVTDNSVKNDGSDKKDVQNKKDEPDKSEKVEEPTKYPEKKPDPVENEPNTEISAEEQALAALQLQQQQAAAMILIGEAALEMPAIKTDGTAKNLLQTLVSGEPLKLPEKPLSGENQKDGSILMNMESSNASLKEALMKAMHSQNQNQEGKEQSQNRNAENLLAGAGKVQEAAGDDVKPVKNDNFNLADTLSDDGEETTVLNNSAKPNTLDMSKVNIKVAEAPVDTSRADMAKQLADKILYKITQGKQEFELELNPKHLGKINIKMTFENGNAELVMSSSNPKAHQLLSTQAEALKAILEGRTGMDSSVTVKQAETNEGQFDRDNFQEQNREQKEQKQQREERKLNDSVSFMERLRLGLTDGLEEAV